MKNKELWNPKALCKFIFELAQLKIYFKFIRNRIYFSDVDKYIESICKNNIILVEINEVDLLLSFIIKNVILKLFTKEYFISNYIESYPEKYKETIQNKHSIFTECCIEDYQIYKNDCQ